MDEVLEALDQLSLAQQNFNYADPQYIDVAVYELKAAEDKLSITIQEQKKKGEQKCF